jgi:clan AA aspartic protease (TIGR02281 family)
MGTGADMTARGEPDGRVEPTLDDTVDWSKISFVSGPRKVPASAVLRGVTYLLVTLNVGFNLWFAWSNGKPLPYLVGAVVGSLLWLMLPVWIAGLWDTNKTQRGRHRVAAVAAGVLLAIQLATLYHARGSINLEAAKPMNSDELAQRGMRCERSGDLACAEESWAEYVKRNPQDGRAMLTLGIVKGRRDDHAGAVQVYEQAIAEGIGGYDLFAYYATSLEHLGRADKALEWYYAALAVSPRLVDVRAAIARLLVAQSRPYEALGVLQAFDSQMQAMGRQPYFTAQRIAIEDKLRDAIGPRAAAEKLRLPAMEGHFYAPVKVGWGRNVPFMVDTGATLTSLSTAMLEDSKVAYEPVDDAAEMVTADGRRVPARVVVLRALGVGPYLLHDVKAIVCKDCAALLGASVLTRFDMQSSKMRGLEFLTLVPRG